MADIVNNTSTKLGPTLQQNKMADEYVMSAKIRSECGEMLVAMRDISHSVTKLATKDEMRSSWKKIKDLCDNLKDLCDNLMDKVVLLSRRVVALETEFEYFRGQIKDLEAKSFIGSKEFIDTQIDSIVKPLEERLLTRIMKIEDKYNMGLCVQDVLNTPVVYSKGKVKGIPCLFW